MNIEELETHYNYKFTTLFTKLWSEGMLDWMNGRTEPFSADESWEKTIYPVIKENPPLFLHTGGFDFEMLTAEEMLHFEFNEFVDLETHKFIPFAKTEEGNIYALYPNIETDKESAVVLIWDDMNETEVLAKNFEDFIFRKMLESAHDIDKDELDADYNRDDFELYRVDLLSDLKSVKPYLHENHFSILEEIFNRENVIDGLFSFSLLNQKELKSIIEEKIDFPMLNKVFEHELP